MSAKVALVFPGQAPIQTGMGQSLYEGLTSVRQAVAEAQKILRDTGRRESLEQLIYDGIGPDEDLVVVHPLLHAISLGAGQHLLDRIRPQVKLIGGYSLGEYTALTLAEVIEVNKAAFLVTHRASLLSQCSGSVARVKAGAETIQHLLADVGDWTISSFNSPTLTNIAGSESAIRTALLRFKAARIAAREIAVNISHSPLVSAAAESYRGYISGMSFRAPKIPVLNASTGKIHRWGSWKSILLHQLVSPVRWLDGVEAMRAQGIDKFIEVGGVTYLTPLIKEICPDAQVFAATDMETIEESIAA